MKCELVKYPLSEQRSNKKRLARIPASLFHGYWLTIAL
jgi:hypothetical protein